MKFGPRFTGLLRQVVVVPEERTLLKFKKKKKNKRTFHIKGTLRDFMTLKTQAWKLIQP